MSDTSKHNAYYAMKLFFESAKTSIIVYGWLRNSVLEVSASARKMLKAKEDAAIAEKWYWESMLEKLDKEIK